MSAKAKAEKDIEVLLAEYERVCSEVRSIESNNDKILGLGLTVITAGFAYGLQHNMAEVFFFVPVALVGALVYWIMQQHYVFWFGGYKRAIEEKINYRSGQVLLGWEKLVAEHRRHLHPINGCMILIYFVIIASISSYSVFKIVSLYSGIFRPAYFAMLSILFVAVIFSGWHLGKVYRTSYEASKKILGARARRPQS